MKAYLVLDLAIHDLDGFRPYIERVPALIERHGGRYIVQGAEPTTIEGDWASQRMVIIEFSARENADRFLNGPDFRTLAQIRHRTTTSRLVLVDGAA